MENNAASFSPESIIGLFLRIRKYGFAFCGKEVLIGKQGTGWNAACQIPEYHVRMDYDSEKGSSADHCKQQKLQRISEIAAGSKTATGCN